ncbi:MAG TPA: flagellar biosynthesis anti-sigma factor FlgM [Gemmatimonas sp.]|nr:flagellar biosynthesis anti-sigma factor FlgM [Gemmatimonas sp.]
MHIDESTFEPARPDQPSTTARTGRLPQSLGTDDEGPGATLSRHEEPVRFAAHIPVSGRPLADRMDRPRCADCTPAFGPDFGPDRIAELRSRVLAGAYDSVDAVDALARRLLVCGDL